MSGMDEEVAIDGKKFEMQRIDARQKLGCGGGTSPILTIWWVV